MRIVFIINGEEVCVETSPTTLLCVAQEKALAASNNTARPADAWELRTLSGSLIYDTFRPVGSICFADELRLFLTLLP